MLINRRRRIYCDESAAREYIEAQRWPSGPICPHCGSTASATRMRGKSTRTGVWKCRRCRKPFTCTIGTIIERSKIPLTKWLLAIDLLSDAGRGCTSRQLKMILGISYKSALFMARRIRAQARYGQWRWPEVPHHSHRAEQAETSFQSDSEPRMVRHVAT